MESTVLGALNLFALIAAKRWWEVVVFSGVVFVLFVLVGLHSPGFLHDRNREQLNFAFTAWIINTLCHQVLPMARYRTLIEVPLCLAFVLRIVMAIDVSKYYSARTAWHRACIEVPRSA